MTSHGLVPIPRCAAHARGDGRILRFRRLVAALALPILASACVPADALTPNAPNTLDAALADVAHPALDQVAAQFSGAGIVTPTIVPSRCPFEAASQSFVCAPLSGGGLTLTQRFTLLNAAGGKQSAFDPNTTAAFHLENSVAGTFARDTYTYTIDGQQTLDLTGLGTSQRTLNGSSLTQRTEVYADRLDHPPVKTTLKTTITDLVLPVVSPGLPKGWPLSGTIDIRSLSDYGEPISGGGTTVISIATLRFSGSSVVTLTHTVPGGIQTCQMDLAITAAVGCTDSTSGGKPLN